MLINSSIEKFEKNIYKEINDSNLPIGIIYFIIKDIFNNISNVYQSACFKEMSDELKEKMEQSIEEKKEE